MNVPANSGEIWIPEELMSESLAPLKTEKIVAPVKIETSVNEVAPVKEKTPHSENDNSIESFKDNVNIDWSKSYEDMTVAELQKAILEKMRSNGPVTDYMLKTVRENTHHGSLVNWVKSFR